MDYVIDLDPTHLVVRVKVLTDVLSQEIYRTVKRLHLGVAHMRGSSIFLKWRTNECPPKSSQNW